MTARQINEKLHERIAQQVFEWTLNNKLDPKKIKITLLGMAFKGVPETNDLRGAPSIIMINELKKRGLKNIHGHDYLVSDEDIKNSEIMPVGIEEAFNNANVAIFMNNNPLYKKIDLSKAVKKMSKPAYFLDSWNMFALEDMSSEKGLYYRSIGRS
ncbi:hypothetical protein ES708_34279 [subsurface metagenome]